MYALEKIDSERDDVETAEEGKGIRPAARIQSLEENERCDDGRCGEANVVYRIDDVGRKEI